MIGIALRVKPHDVCLVPERRAELTTEGGLDVKANLAAVQEACARLSAAGIRVSLFINAQLDQIDAAHAAGRSCGGDPHRHLRRRGVGAPAATSSSLAFGLQLAMPQDWDSRSTPVTVCTTTMCRRSPPSGQIAELNIGHAIVAHALFVGWVEAIREMKRLMMAARGGGS